MNMLAHIFITFSVLSLFIPNAREYFLAIAFFSVILDIDHIPGYVRMALMPKKDRRKISHELYSDMLRSAVQEPIGVLTIELCFLALYMFGQGGVILGIAAASLLIHWLIDFLTVTTRPFAPGNKRQIVLFFRTKKQKMYREIIITSASLILFLISYF